MRMASVDCACQSMQHFADFIAETSGLPAFGFREDLQTTGEIFYCGFTFRPAQSGTDFPSDPTNNQQLTTASLS